MIDFGTHILQTLENWHLKVLHLDWVLSLFRRTAGIYFLRPYIS